MNFQENVCLAEYTTFKIGGPAQYFFNAKTKEELIKAVSAAKEQELPYFVLGGGSNVLVSDEGFEGLVIKVNNETLRLTPQGDCSAVIYAEAGVELKDLVEFSVKEGLTGLEWAAGIPRATVGGAIQTNAGAFDGAMQDIVKKVEVLPDTEIVISALLELKKGDKVAIQKQIDYILNYRETNHPMNLPSVGCIFKNPESAPAAQLIEQSGLKGKTIGQAQISEKHANFIVNLGGAKAEDVCELIKLTKQKVKEKFSIELKEEIKYVGF